jgi:predicted ATP-dependent endonuclease of OLD family
MRVGVAPRQPFRCVDPLDFSYERLAQKLRRGGNSEVLFAAAAIFCEGQDDVAATRALLEDLGVDADSVNISVVDCGGRDTLPDYVRLLDALQIDVLVITDGDASKVKDNDDTKRKVEAVEAAAKGRMFRFVEDIETALNTEKQRDNATHLVGLIEALDLPQLPPEHEIAQLADALLTLCRREPAPAETHGQASSSPS